MLLPARHPTGLAAAAAAAEEAGCELVCVGDSPLAFREAFTSLTVVAGATRRARVGTAVTNGVTRDVSVLASAIATVDELSAGRAVLGLGTGDSAVRAIGRRPATLEELAGHVAAVRALLEDHADASHTGTLRWTRRRIPVLLAAEGPATLRLAGRVADGVIVGCGLTAEHVARSLSLIAEGAVADGRRPGDLDIWFFARISVDADPDRALSALRSGLAASAHRALRGSTLPPRVRAEVDRLVSSYDVSDHLSDRTDRNAALVADPVVLGHLADRFAIWGPQPTCAARIRELEDLGVTGLLISAALPPRGGPDPADRLDDLLDLVEACR